MNGFSGKNPSCPDFTVGRETRHRRKTRLRRNSAVSVKTTNVDKDNTNNRHNGNDNIISTKTNNKTAAATAISVRYCGSLLKYICIMNVGMYVCMCLSGFLSVCLYV